MSSECDEWRLIRGGVLCKRGTHVNDKYYPRTNTNIMCDFLSMEDVESASTTDELESHDEREFIVHVKQSKDQPGKTCADNMLSQRKGRKEGNLPARFSHRPVPNRSINWRTSSERELPIPEDSVWEAASRPQSYHFRASTASERNSWIHDINCALENHRADTARLEYERGHFALRLQKQIRRVYVSIEFQMSTACLIAVNFFIMMFQAQTSRYSWNSTGNSTMQVIQSPGALSDDFLGSMEIVFTGFFSVELLANMVAFWCRSFFSDLWNWFDMFVIGTSIWGLADNSGGVNFLRLFRALRVFKLVRKLQSMRKILNSLGACVKPVLSAFFMLFILMSIYAQVGYTFFGSIQPDWFGCYSLAMITLVQILTFDGWVDHLARDMLDASSDPGMEFAIGSYMISWAFLSGFIMMNIVLAILVESFTAAQDAMRSEHQEMSERKRVFTPSQNPMEKLIAQWGSMASREKLDKTLERTFSVLDLNGSGTLECWEIQRHLWNYFGSRLSDEMFHEVTAGRTLCEPDGSLNSDGFKIMAYALVAHRSNGSDDIERQSIFDCICQRITNFFSMIFPVAQSASDQFSSTTEELGDITLQNRQDENFAALKALQKAVEDVHGKFEAVNLVLAKLDAVNARLDCMGFILAKDDRSDEATMHEMSISNCSCYCDFPSSHRTGRKNNFNCETQYEFSFRQCRKHSSSLHACASTPGTVCTICCSKVCYCGAMDGRAENNVQQSETENTCDYCHLAAAEPAAALQESVPKRSGSKFKIKQDASAPTIADPSKRFPNTLLSMPRQHSRDTTSHFCIIEQPGTNSEQHVSQDQIDMPDLESLGSAEQSRLIQPTLRAPSSPNISGLMKWGNEITPKRPRSLARGNAKAEQVMEEDESVVTEEFDLISEATEHARAAFRPGWAAVRLCQRDRVAYTSRSSQGFGHGPAIARDLRSNGSEDQSAAMHPLLNYEGGRSSELLEDIQSARNGRNNNRDKSEQIAVVVAQNDIPIKILQK